MIILEIDEELVSICREYMPEWSDCSDIRGGNISSCFDDPRASIIYTDAFQWFVDQLGDDGTWLGGEKFDVIIMDALDPMTNDVS